MSEVRVCLEDGTWVRARDYQSDAFRKFDGNTTYNYDDGQGIVFQIKKKGSETIMIKEDGSEMAIRAFNIIPSSTTTSYLKSLTIEERDSLLASIIYVDNPKHHEAADLEEENEGMNIMNYSQIFASLDKKVKLPPPAELRTGDSVQFGEYRGTASFYVMWLKKGLINHSTDVLEVFNSSLEEGDWVEQSLEAETANEDEPLGKKAKIESTDNEFLRFISRDTDGPHNDGLHDCYISTHPDEMGYAPSSAFSSLPAGYFPHLEFECAVFDPLVTHSKSFCGQFVSAAKASEEYQDNADFPLQYIGDYNKEVSDEPLFLSWNDAKKSNCFGNYFRDMRRLFSAHFAPQDWVDGDESDCEDVRDDEDENEDC